jgi:UDP-N-acetylglucosamine--N-acetylmuramyl-(pentapeptide) pyrophosphoryl-undecaprenol N-acetylglucosamine transferase
VVPAWFTLAEIAAAGRAAILIPFRAATGDHQLRNAEMLERAGAARLIRQDELTPQRLAREVFSLLDQPQQICALEQGARALARPGAAEKIADLLEEMARQ